MMSPLEYSLSDSGLQANHDKCQIIMAGVSKETKEGES